MKFKYSAKTKIGELQAGFVEAPSKEMAVNTLTGHDLYILSLESTEKVNFFDQVLGIFRRVKKSDLMVFTRQFATLLSAKISLYDALKNLYKQTRNPILKEAVFEISTDVDSGLSLSQALEKQEKIFSDFYISMIRSAEITGRIDEAMEYMADHLEKETNLNTKVINALIYPAIIVVLLIAVAGIMVGFVFPQIKPIFEESGAQIPLVSKWLLAGGAFMSEWWWAIILALLVMIIILVDYFRSPEGRVVLDEILIKMPYLGELFKKVYVARFVESTSILIRGGIPISQALEISGHNVGSIVYRDAIHEIADEVRQGKLFSQALEEHEQYFPSLVSQMVAVGESTGKLDELLSRAGLFFAREVDASLGNLVELIQPLLMIVMGVGVGLLFAAILLPIYSLVQSF